MFFLRAKLLKKFEDSFKFVNILTFFALFLKNFIKFAPMMKITQLSAQEYFRTFPSPQHVYNSAPFLNLNAPKVSEIIHLCITDGKPRLGLSIGRRADGSLHAPFSAPFSGFDFNRRQSAETMLDAARALRQEFPGLRLTLPPAPYSTDMNARTLLALTSAGARIAFADWNFYIPLEGQNYTDLLPSSAKNKLRLSLNSPLKLIPTNGAPLRAYEIIRRNRSQKGFPLRMSADDVVQTTSGKRPPVRADFFVLTDESADIAAAMVYHPAPAIAQVIYWGNDLELQSPGEAPMNLLAYLLAEHYQQRNFKVLDIGPSSSDGIPSPGLCNFKDSIGCIVTPKPTLIL